MIYFNYLLAVLYMEQFTFKTSCPAYWCQIKFELFVVGIYSSPISVVGSSST